MASEPIGAPDAAGPTHGGNTPVTDCWHPSVMGTLFDGYTTTRSDVAARRAGRAVGRDVPRRRRHGDGARAVPRALPGARPHVAGRAARPHRGARQLLPRAGRHVRLRGRGAAVPARRRAARHRGRRVEPRRGRASRSACGRSRRSSPTSTARSTRCATASSPRRSSPRRRTSTAQAAGIVQRERRARPRLRHRPDPRRAAAPGGCSRTTCACRAA